MPEVFYPNCTFPGDDAGIVATPDMRGTLDILWSCLAVVILCTWVVLHENVPAEGDTKSQDWKQRLFLDLYLAVQKICSFGWALFAPELFTGKAMMGLYFAHHVRDIMQKAMNKDQSAKEVDWTLQHAFLANMGGYSIEFDEDSAPASVNRSQIRSARQKMQEGGQRSVISCYTAPLSSPVSPAMTPGQIEAQPEKRPDVQGSTVTAIPSVDDKLRAKLIKLFNQHEGNKWFIFPLPAVVQGRWKEDPTNLGLIESAIKSTVASNLDAHTPHSYFQNLIVLRGNIWVVDGMQLAYARSIGIITAIPPVTDDEIMDRSKGDWVTKALAIIQVAWLWIQLIVRTTQQLTATQLEIMTAAFATCSVFTYALYLPKPKDVKTRIRIRAARYPTVEEMKTLGRKGPSSVWFQRIHLQLGNDNIHHREGKHSALVMITLCGFIAMVFAAVHFACWHSHFPTWGEQLGWRIACGILLVAPVPICGLMLWDHDLESKRMEESARTQPGALLKRMSLALEGVYVLARLFMMVEAGRSLYYQPKESFVATWGFIPHV
ncbi:hypothetical protein QBC40DRAFT_187058 [Triangularia verruculosa]|uniref:Uncharacterized protein n=1 Tax=Triangularia verruculosa TaxID=2587418 RepID=A0AAN6X6L4_9PEZI|nr:hypothetical protein QBC40DRAFT_187058 [Triangularia verruculosa]